MDQLKAISSRDTYGHRSRVDAVGLYSNGDNIIERLPWINAIQAFEFRSDCHNYF